MSHAWLKKFTRKQSKKSSQQTESGGNPPGAKPSLATLKKAGFSTFLTNVVTKVVETGADVADSLQSRLQLGPREAPPLETVFGKQTAWGAPGAPAPSSSGGAAAAERKALLGEGPSGGAGPALAAGGRAVGVDGRPRARTAEEVRAAYGAKQKRYFYSNVC